ncbi:hypothetical protein O2N63_01935 [Aliiroseovarius sp. KMU-50]|uniref:Glutamine amidotransferase domain-containing protein n=1 Tax=Aliiroseovarius salicola TaxID=3009082 RepID=A0ABT4VX53_9RHOB|nr:hypothetical protein [Aliiroseovarius sp. KMU-50]MDA5092843.1 hypothetical protein [Aliiroseovarius sp. KMU-50]
MAKLGILLACEHYPEVVAEPARVDAQLRLWLQDAGHDINGIRVFNCFLGDFPECDTDCDLWIVSGALIDLNHSYESRLCGFLCAVAAAGRPLMALNHGEHVVHKALAADGASPPATPELPRSIRNPFNSFWRSDTLFAFSASSRSLKALPRPTELMDLGFIKRFAA